MFGKIKFSRHRSGSSPNDNPSRKRPNISGSPPDGTHKDDAPLETMSPPTSSPSITTGTDHAGSDSQLAQLMNIMLEIHQGQADLNTEMESGIQNLRTEFSSIQKNVASLESKVE